MGAARVPRRDRDGRFQPRRAGCRAHRGTRRARRVRRLRPRARGGPRARPRRPPARPSGAPRRAAGRGRGLRRPGLGPYRPGGHRLVRRRARRRGRLRRARRSGAEATGTETSLRGGVRDRGRRVGGRRTRPGRRCDAADAAAGRGARPALAGGGRHGHRLRLLVRRRPADRRRARHPLLRADPGVGGVHRTPGRHRLVRSRPGGGQRAGGGGCRARFRSAPALRPRRRRTAAPARGWCPG